MRSRAADSILSFSVVKVGQAAAGLILINELEELEVQLIAPDVEAMNAHPLLSLNAANYWYHFIAVIAVVASEHYQVRREGGN
jgi:hypothetical protein